MMNNVFNEVGRVFDNAVEEKAAHRLDTFTCEELCDWRLERVSYTVENFLRPGLAVLAGAPKVGKSWMVLHLCMQIAKGLPFWGMDTKQGSVLYIALEDSHERLQERALCLSDSHPCLLHFSLNCAPLGDQLEEELRSFVSEHPDARLVVFDTFQKIRAQGVELSYANDYSEVSRLKRIADELHICILLIHHTRKQADSDFMNEISGTNGIAGCADTLMVVKKESRSSRTATLSCTGRDIEDRELTLHFNRDSCIWEVRNDTLVPVKRELPRELALLAAYMMHVNYSFSSMSDFTSDYCRCTGVQIEPNQLKRLMNRFRYDLEDMGVSFATIRRNTARMLAISYAKPGSTGAPDQKDEPDSAVKPEDANAYAVSERGQSAESNGDHRHVTVIDPVKQNAVTPQKPTVYAGSEEKVTVSDNVCKGEGRTENGDLRRTENGDSRRTVKGGLRPHPFVGSESVTDDDDAPPANRHCEEAAKPPTRQSQPKTEDDAPPLPDDDDAPPIPDYCDVPPMPDDWDAPPLPDDDDAPPERGELDPAWRREEELLWEMFG